MATLALLFGMSPAPVESCRVLELGCGDGGNLIPMAVELPGSRFTGVELAKRPVAHGRQTIRALGLENIELHDLDLRAVGSEFGEFDYITAHGLYSWVPAETREKLLAICSRNLAPNGVAYVSHLVHPGAHVSIAIRGMLLHHVQGVEDASERIRKARQLLKQLADSQPDSDLKKEYETLLARRDGSLYHDELAEEYSPAYFHEFIGKAARHRLQFLAEANFLANAEIRSQSAGVDMPLEVPRKDVLAREQYLDFAKFRRFRQTLLCHEEAAIDRNLRPAIVEKLFAASAARTVPELPDIESGARERFEGPRGAAIETANPLVKATLQLLSRVWPQSLSFSSLVAELQSRHDRGPRLQADPAVVADIVLDTFRVGLTDLHAYAFRFVLHGGDLPTASPLARLQAQHGDIVTNLRHQTVRIEDDFSRRFLTWLDGTRDRAELLRLLSSIPELGAPLSGLARRLDESLNRLARLSLLAA